MKLLLIYNPFSGKGKKYKIEQPEYAVSDTKGSFPMFGKRDIVLGKNILSGKMVKISREVQKIQIVELLMQIWFLSLNLLQDLRVLLM